jgi:sugar-specific transcriptional regulator TrmB
MYEKELKELGLTDNEVNIYLLLLKQGAMGPAEIAQKLGLHRGYVYDALERMQEKEVISTVLVNNKKQFQATPPKNLVELLQLRLGEFQKVVPDLEKLMLLKKEETNIEVHKGKKVYRTLIQDVLSELKPKEEVLLIGIDEQTLVSEIEPIYLKQYLNIIKTQDIHERAIIKKGRERLKHKNIVYKELDEKFIGNTSLIIYDSKVAFFILGTPYYLIIITNKEIADTYRKQFDLFWNVAQ